MFLCVLSGSYKCFKSVLKAWAKLLQKVRVKHHLENVLFPSYSCVWHLTSHCPKLKWKGKDPKSSLGK